MACKLLGERFTDLEASGIEAASALEIYQRELES